MATLRYAAVAKAVSQGLNRKSYREVRERTLTEAVARGTSPKHVEAGRAIQACLDSTVLDLEFAQEQVEALPMRDFFRDTKMSGRIPHEWIRYRDTLRDSVFSSAERIVRAGIAEREVRVQEAQVALLVQVVKDAAVRSGLDQKQIVALGRELREVVNEQGVVV